MDETTTPDQLKRIYNQHDLAGETACVESARPAVALPKPDPQSVGRSAHRYSDADFWSEFPDDAAARTWFESIFWPDGAVHCPRCESCHVDGLGNDTHQPYRCRECERDFSVTSDTLMDGLNIPLLEWSQALFIFTGSVTLCSRRELSRRIGWDEETAREAVYRLLLAMQEPIIPLREPAELDCADLPYPPDHLGEAKVIALVGRYTRRVAGLKIISSETKKEIESFVHERLAKGMTLFTDSHLSLKDIRDVDQPERSSVNHGAHQYVRGPGCINLDEGLWRRVKRLLQVDFDWFFDRSLSLWLDGIQWRENRRRLSHRERMAELARGLRSQPSPPKQDSFSRRLGLDAFSERLELEPPPQPRCQDCRNSNCRAEREESVWGKRRTRAARVSHIRRTWDATES